MNDASRFLNEESVRLLIEECGLVPASLVTQKMVDEALLSLRIRRQSLSSFDKDIQDEFLKQFVDRQYSRKRSDSFYPQLKFDFHGEV